MPNEVEAVLFDLDETLCVYRQSTDEVLSVAFETVDVDPFFDGAQYVDRFDEFLDAGDRIDAIREACFTALAEEAGHDAAVGPTLAAAYAAERDGTAVEFTPGAERALESLAGTYRLGLVTNGDPGLQAPKLERLGIDDRFDTVVHAGVDAAYKPDPAPFRLALDELGVEPGQAVHVGNSLDADVAGAHAAGLASVWVATDGFERDPGPDPQPHHVVKSMRGVVDEPWA